jgi:hypothetical protein
MADKTVRYTPEFRRQIIELARNGGTPAGWIDDSHLLVNNFVNDYQIYSDFDYAGCSLYSVTGAAAGTCELPEVLAFQNVSSGTITPTT